MLLGGTMQMTDGICLLHVMEALDYEIVKH
jgi:hypothetical protein